MPPSRILDRIARLRIDRARANPAPHKPLLLLVVLELAEKGKLSDHLLPLTPELAFRFCAFWSIVAHRWAQERPRAQRG
jgi:putative restriction endonuclease